MHQLRIFIAPLFVVVFIMISGTRGVAEENNANMPELPSIIYDNINNVPSFVVNLVVVERVQTKCCSDTINTSLDFNKLPKPTQDYFNNIIMNEFINHPTDVADRFYGVNVESYDEMVDIFLTSRKISHVLQ